MLSNRLIENFDIPIIPLQCIEELPATLQKFHRSFLQADASSRQHSTRALDTGAVQTLLPYCALSPPLREHSINILSDLTVGFADLANKTNSEAGRAQIAGYLGQEEAKRIILFWMQEFLLSENAQ